MKRGRSLYCIQNNVFPYTFFGTHFSSFAIYFFNIFFGVMCFVYLFFIILVLSEIFMDNLIITLQSLQINLLNYNIKRMVGISHLGDLCQTHVHYVFDNSNTVFLFLANLVARVSPFEIASTYSILPDFVFFTRI